MHGITFAPALNILIINLYFYKKISLKIFSNILKNSLLIHFKIRLYD